MSGPSDKLFRYGYTHPDVAEAALRHNLLPELVASIHWPTLRNEPEIVVDPERETRKDVVFSAQLLGSRKQDPLHFFLVEHQMKVELRMAWRMHDYTRRVVEYFLRQHPKSKRIPEDTPLVVYVKPGGSYGPIG